MLILNKELKNKCDFSDLKNENLYNHNIYEHSINKNQSIHYPSSTKEWYNSIYNYYKNKSKALLVKDLQVYKLFNTYFNFYKLKNNNNFSLSKIFIGKPEIKHFTNKINITLYIYNRQIVYLKKYFLIYRKFVDKFNLSTKMKLGLSSKKDLLTFIISKIIRNLTNRLLKIKTINKILYRITFIGLKSNLKFIVKFCESYLNKNKILSKNIKFNLISLNNIYKKLSIEIMYDILNKYIFLNKYKFNINNLLYVKNLLHNIYNKNIELNIVNLKYLHLDSHILAVLITKKLKNRNRRVLRVIRLALKLSKKLYINDYTTYYLNVENIDNILIRKDINKNLKEIPFNKNIIQKPFLYNNRIVLYFLNNKIIKGIALQGSGRLTKRLTASRSITKINHKGSLKNNKSSIKGLSTIMLKGYVKSNLQYSNINSYNLIGAYGIKSWISNY